MSYSIYIPEKSDYFELVELWEASVRATHTFLKESDILYFKPLILNEYLAAVDLFCTKNESGEITGFVGIADGTIEMLFVKPSYFGKGIGKFLLQFVVEKKGSVRVDVNEQNWSALTFYKHLGFDVIKRSATDGLGKPYPILHMALQ
jgi:putative acetyltransferase